MSSKILVLPEKLVNQIAAGEVVERPSSVVKELVENALDAGSREVRVETQEGGRGLIRVADDGEGMGREDALACLSRYATSKIRDLSDLHRVHTYGFRGEALPSIASVSRLGLMTKRSEDATATEIRAEGGKIERVGQAGAPNGTLVEVSDLFFNTPARLKFLKRSTVESSHVTEVMEQIALARPEVGFSLVQGGRTVLEAPPTASLASRMTDVLGPEGSGLLPLEREAWGIRAEGFVSPPERTLASSKLVQFFVNRRPVRDRTLHHAVLSAAREFIPQDRFPVAFLYIEVPPDAVDVNVHPAKREVRFRDARAVHELVRQAILDALRRWTPVSFPATQARADPSERPHDHAERVQESLERFFRSTPGSAGGIREAPSISNQTPVASTPHEALRFLGQSHETYLVFQAEDGIVIIDQHAAHERITFERLRGQARTGGIPAQRLLVPRTVDLSPARRARLEVCRDALASLGLEFEPFGGNTVAVKSLPVPLTGTRVEALLVALADDLPDSGEPDALDRALDRALATVACHASVRAGQRLERAEVEALLASMDETPGAGTCPHGRPVAIRLPLSDLERMFRRT